MRKQVLSLLVENNPGVTSHISGLSAEEVTTLTVFLPA